jgi:hypothetical protein
MGVDSALPGDYSVRIERPVITQEDDDEIKRAIESIDEEDDDEIILEEPDDLSFLSTKEQEIFLKAKPIEQAFSDIKEKIQQEVKTEEKKRPRFSKPNPKPVLSPELTKELDELVGEIEEKPTKDIIVPIEKDYGTYEFSPRPEIDDIEDEDDDIDIDFEDVIKEEYKKEPEEIEESGDLEERYNKEIQPKEPLTEVEIKEMFEDAAHVARKNQYGKVSSVIYEPGGKVRVDHSIQDQDEEIDFAKQE